MKISAAMTDRQWARFRLIPMFAAMLFATGIRALVNAIQVPLSVAIVREGNHLLQRSYPDTIAMPTPFMVWREQIVLLVTAVVLIACGTIATFWLANKATDQSH
ncbi:MAG TPA: hypothetical protein VGF44_13885 [Terriglobales bacterium]|jgi:hypothetical protein